MKDKFLSLLGMARRANRLITGCEPSVSAARGGGARVIFYARDMSERAVRQLNFAGEENGVKVIGVDYSMQDITDAVGIKTGVAAVCDNGFAKRLCELLDNNK